MSRLDGRDVQGSLDALTRQIRSDQEDVETALRALRTQLLAEIRKAKGEDSDGTEK